MTQTTLDRKARDQLIQEHLGYVRALAGQLKAQLSLQLDFDELVAFGSKGLVEAANRFDPSRGVSFITFSYYRIRGAIFDGLRQSGRLSRSEYARFSSAANEYLTNQSDRAAPPAPGSPSASPASPDEAAAELKDALGDLVTIYITSLGASYEEDPADRETPDASELLETREACEAIRVALNRIPAKERHLIDLYYFQDNTLEEAGRALGLSKSWASRLHARAIRMLAKEVETLAGS